ncbi:MAG: helix-turn-helix transcriptional regulator [Pseudomonadota bacterium]
MSEGGFPENLRFLCSYKTSISQVCRDLAVNRSQFNRYLSGASAPRPGLMRKICDYFGIELHEAHLPPADFERLINVRGMPEARPGQWLEPHFERVLQASSERALELRGTFFEYYFSMAMPGSIIRSLIALEARHGAVFYRRLERIGPWHKSNRRHCRFQGIAVMLGDRIFLTDYDAGLGMELSQTILYPDYASRVSTLLGIRLGIAAHQQRWPCCARVYLERTPAGNSWRQNLRLCGLYPSDSPEIEDSIKQAIDNSQTGRHQFLAYTSP